MGLLQPGHTGLEITSFHQPSRIIAAGIYVGKWYEVGFGRYLRAGDQGFLLTAFVYEIREST